DQARRASGWKARKFRAVSVQGGLWHLDCSTRQQGGWEPWICDSLRDRAAERPGRSRISAASCSVPPKEPSARGGRTSVVSWSLWFWIAAGGWFFSGPRPSRSTSPPATRSPPRAGPRKGSRAAAPETSEEAQGSRAPCRRARSLDRYQAWRQAIGITLALSWGRLSGCRAIPP